MHILTQFPGIEGEFALLFFCGVVVSYWVNKLRNRIRNTRVHNMITDEIKSWSAMDFINTDEYRQAKRSNDLNWLEIYRNRLDKAYCTDYDRGEYYRLNAEYRVYEDDFTTVMPTIKP